jgi:SpoVK/Ycf46/Vps4 family AAA+-type ATPase
MSPSPVLLFFDEVDALVPSRDSHASDGGGVLDRVVSTFITEIDTLMSSQPAAASSSASSSSPAVVIIVCATNRVDLVDKSLLRPGRIDK